MKDLIVLLCTVLGLLVVLMINVPSGGTLKATMIKSGLIKWVTVDNTPRMVLQDESMRAIIDEFDGWGIGADLVLKKSEVK